MVIRELRIGNEIIIDSDYPLVNRYIESNKGLWYDRRYMREKILTREDFVRWGALGGNATKKKRGNGYFKEIRKKVKSPGPKPKATF